MAIKHVLRGRWRLLIVGIVLLSLLLAAPIALAGEFRAADKVIIGPDEVVDDDFYVAGGTIIVEGTIKGDLIAAGGEITVNGTVEGDLMAAGQFITINGVVEDDVRIAGNILSVGRGAQIGDDVFAAGYSFEAAAGSAIGGGVFMAGYQARLGGEVEEDVNAAVGALEIAGRIGGDVTAEVGEADPQFEAMRPFFAMWMPAPMMAPGLSVAEGAEIGGKLTYTSGTEAEIPAEARVVGGIMYQTPVPPPEVVEEVKEVSPAEAVGGWFLSQLRRLAILLLIGLLLLWIAPGWMGEAATALQARPLTGLGWGIVVTIVVFLVIPIVLVVMVILDIAFGLLGLGGLVASVTGLGLLTNATILVVFLITAVYITKVVVSFLVGRLLLERVQPAWAAGRVWPLVIGVVLFVVIRAIPILGGLISLVVTLLGLGAIWLLGRNLYRQRRVALV